MKVPPKTIHDWRVRGVLVDEIKTAFYKIPGHSRGPYFPWFLQNQRIVALAGQPLSAEEIHDYGDAMLVRTWRFTGGSERDSPEDIRAANARKPAEEQKCCSLYTLLLYRWIPCPGLDLWIDFGFASCTSQEEQRALGFQYQRLITMCTFGEFCDAFRNRHLLNLFHSKGLQVNNNDQLRDLLSGPLPVGWRKSVWDLKAFVLQEDSAESDLILLSVMMDYGFINCRNASEKRQLMKAYKDFFVNPHGDPLALHEAATRGNLHGFLSNKVQGLRGPKFQRLLKNPYAFLYLAFVPRRSRFSAWLASSFILKTTVLFFVFAFCSVLLVRFLMQVPPL